jgi:iron complex outermembrane receptor protein
MEMRGKQTRGRVPVALWLTGLLLHLAGAAFAAGSDESRTGEELLFQLETMTVTAEKREGDVQDIAGSLVVLDEVRIEDSGLGSVRDIVAMTPNLYVTDTGASSFASLRGIGASMIGAPTVGVYIDDVYTTLGLDAGLVDVERVEVLRGPQGTLYGRNSEAGVINVVTKKPGKAWEGRFSADGGAFDSYEGTVVFSGPLLRDALAFRGVLRYRESDRWFENRFNGSDEACNEEKLDGRFTFSATPSERLDLKLSYEVRRHENPNYANFALFHQGGALRKNVNVDYMGESDRDTDVVSLKAGYDFGDMRLVSISSFINEDSLAANDVDFMPIELMNMTIRSETTTFSQEFRLHSTDASSPLQWLLGGFFLYEEKDGSYSMFMNFMNMGMGIPGETLTAKSETTTTGGALFGEATYTFAERLHLTLGLRYDREEQEFDYNQPQPGPGLSMMGYGPESGSRDDSHDAWLPKAALSYDLTPNVMPYVSVSRGFRSGGYNTVDNLGSSFEPEFTWNYEAGIKTTWLDKRLQLNAALFYIDWTDMQVEVLTAGGSAVYVNNAAEASSQGFELELAARPVAGLDLFAGFAYTDAEYDDYSVGADVYDGNTITDVPEYTFNVGGTYRFGPGLFASLLYTHFGAVTIDVENTREQEDYGLLSGRLGYESDKFDIYLYARNLLDEEYTTRQVQTMGHWAGRAGEPLMIGARLTVRL